MAVVISGEYLGKKRCRLLHEDSGAQITTDAPKDNNGEGASFSPTDLFAASLGACMMTVMGIVAERDGVDLTGMRMRVEKHMSTTAPRKIVRLPVTLHMPKSLSSEQRTKLERTALTCPVHHSRLPEIDAPVEFVYDV